MEENLKLKITNSYFLYAISLITLFIKKQSNEPKVKKINPIPTAKNQSPTLLTIIALKADLFACTLVYQKLTNKYEHKPTPSHPKNICKKFPEVNKKTIKKVNKFIYAIYLIK